MRRMAYALGFLLVCSMAYYLAEGRQIRADMSGGSGASEDRFFDAYARLNGSEYLRGEWAKTCDYNLSDPSTILFIAEVNETENRTVLSCRWGMKPEGVSGGAVDFADGPSDVNGSWLRCGEDGSFAEEVNAAIHAPGCGLMCLTEGVAGKGDTTAYVFAGRCHFWNRTCPCSPSGANPSDADGSRMRINAAYAVLDAQTGRVYW